MWWFSSTACHLAFEPDHENQADNHASPNQRQPGNYADSIGVRKQSQCARSEHAAGKRQRKDSVEQAWMVIRKPPPDSLSDQRIDRGKSETCKQNAHGRTEQIAREEQQDAAECCCRCARQQHATV